MPHPLHRLPHRALSFSFGRQGEATAACQIASIGFSLETDPSKYRWDNRRREHACLFQYTLSGEGVFEDVAAGKIWAMGAGQGFLVPWPSPTRYWLAEGRRWEFIYICFEGGQAFEQCRFLNRQYGYVFSPAPAGLAIGLLGEIYREALSNRRPDPFATSARLYGFLMELHRHQQPVPDRWPAGLAKVKRYMDEHWDEPGLTVGELAEIGGYSKYHFIRLYRRHVGVTPYAYLIEARLQRALELTATTSLPLKEVAETCRFNDYCAFGNAFRKHFGKTPATLRSEQHSLGIAAILSSRGRDRIKQPGRSGPV